MAKRFSLSHEELPLNDLYRYKVDAETGLKLLFATPEDKEDLLFLSRAEIADLLTARIEELDRQATFTLLASLEAMFQINFRSRVQEKSKDNLSRAFRGLAKENNRISFEQDIIARWEQAYPETRRYFQLIKKALQYRHWLAHGRYWLLKHPKFEFDEIFEIAEALQDLLENEIYRLNK